MKVFIDFDSIPNIILKQISKISINSKFFKWPYHRSFIPAMQL